MSKAKGIATLSGMVDTDLEHDTLNDDAFPTPDSNQENARPQRRSAKSKPVAKRLTKPRAPSRRTSGASIASRNAPISKAKPARKRVPLKDQTHQHSADETEEVDDFAAQTPGDAAMDDPAESKQKAKKTAPGRTGNHPVKQDVRRQIAETQKDGEFEYTPTANRTIKISRGGPDAKSKNIIQESQAPVETDQSMLPEEDDNEEDRQMPQSTYRRPLHTRNTSQRRQPVISRRRAGSASDTDRPNGGDPAIRRKLGEMTRKLENLDLKYRNLREVGIKEAETNYEKLRTQSEAKAKAANDLINALKRELATQRSLSADTSSIQKQISTRDADLNKLHALADDLSTQLTEAQSENKALQAKLANTRSVSTAGESLGTKTPGGVLRARQQMQGGRTVMVGSAEATQAAQVAQLKEDLYSDLTGLIMRGVEKGTESDVYDCIQTGRNGSESPSFSSQPFPLHYWIVYSYPSYLSAIRLTFRLPPLQPSTSNSPSPKTQTTATSRLNSNTLRAWIAIGIEIL